MFSLSRQDRARASLLSILSLDSLPNGFVASSLCEELASLLAPSSSEPSCNAAVSVGVPAVISLLVVCILVDNLAVVVFRHTGFLKDTMIVNWA